MREPITPRWRARLSQPKRILLLYRSLRLHYCEFQIPETPQSPPLQGVYIGEGLSLPYYLKLYGAVARQDRTIPAWRASAAISLAIASLPIVLVEINRLLDFVLPPGGLRADSWLQQETDLDSLHYRQRRRGIEKGWGQAVRKHGYRYTLSKDPLDLARFYHEYYLPHLINRHGEVASLRTIQSLKESLREGFLLQVWHDEAWVSGVVADHAEADRLSLLAAGLHASHSRRMQDGALSAAYYFAFRWAEENQVRAVNFCGSRPNLMDGVFQHKKLWAALPKHDPWHHTEIVFFLAPGVRLPEAIEQQLISHGTGFITIREHSGSQSGG
jgi:hypothetical protein